MTGRREAGWRVVDGMGLAIDRNGGPCCLAGGIDVMEIQRPPDFGDIAPLGLTLAEATLLLQAVAAAQAHGHAILRPAGSSCSGGRHIKDWRLHQLFGTVAVQLPRFR